MHIGSGTDLEHLSEDDFERVCLWLEEHRINVLNIAGPRESSCQGIGKQAERFLVDVLKLENEN